MTPSTITEVVQGKYYWELVFNFDNTSNNLPITRNHTVYTRKTVETKEFLRNKFNISAGFKFDNQTSASVKFEGVGEGSESVSYQVHLDLAHELERTSETAGGSVREETVATTYTVGGGMKLALYQLCYVSDSVSTRTDTVSTASGSDVLVDLRFSCIKRIPGLQQILDAFGRIRPREDNKEEWLQIRNSVVRYSDRPQDQAFKAFVEVLKGINPGRDNRDEWAEIRTTCGELLQDWDSTEHTLLLKKLLNRFLQTEPREDNREEWATIRGTSDKIVTGLEQLF
jgi:hypothetical protein